MDKLFYSISQHIHLSQPLQQELKKRIVPLTFKKKELVHNASQICRRSLFIEKGILRLYYLKDGMEVTEFFCSENNWINSPRSFMQQTKDIYYIDAIEESKVYSLDIGDLLFLFDHFVEMEKYARMDMGSAFVYLLDRLAILRFSTPKEKYGHFLQTYSDIHHRLPLGMVASYIGIAQETLSRLRHKP